MTRARHALAIYLALLSAAVVLGAADSTDARAERLADEIARSLTEDEDGEPVYDPSGEVGSALEEKLSEALGAEVELAFAPVDSRYLIQRGDRWAQTTEDVSLRVLSYGPDLEVTSGLEPMGFRGPVVGYREAGSDSPAGSVPAGPLELEEDFTWGGLVEVAVPLEESGRWTFNTGLRYLTFSVPFASQRDVVFDVMPSVAVVGIGVRF